MRAINRFLIVDNIKLERKVVGGLELMDNQDANNRYLKGKVISAGSLVEGINEGDVVFYDRHAGHSIELTDKKH